MYSWPMYDIFYALNSYVDGEHKQVAEQKGQVKSPYIIHASQIVQLFYRFLEWSIAAYVFIACMETMVIA